MAFRKTRCFFSIPYYLWLLYQGELKEDLKNTAHYFTFFASKKADTHICEYLLSIAVVSSYRMLLFSTYQIFRFHYLTVQAKLSFPNCRSKPPVDTIRNNTAVLL